MRQKDEIGKDYRGVWLVIMGTLLIFQLLCICWIYGEWISLRTEIRVYRENKELRLLVRKTMVDTQAATERWCATHIRLGEAYRVTLDDIMTRLKLQPCGSAAHQVLQAYNTALSPSTIGIGGPAPGEDNGMSKMSK